ncbi:MAG: 50S ribosomal protein L10 [Desulfamplus sp.]|nr:50S ribosomal protein L10 [Desulfamplus sp.]
MNLTAKKDLVTRLNSCLTESEIALLVEYKGLDVEAMTQLRNELRKEGSQLEVVKNTLLSIASEGTDISVLKDFFKGPNAIVTSKSDPVAPAKVLVKFANDNQKLEIKVGAMNGKVLNFDDIKALSTMPPREVLLAQVLSTMNAVPTAMVRVLGEVPRSLLYVLNSIGDQKKAA